MIATALAGSLGAIAGLAATVIIGRRWVLPWYLRRYYARKGVPPAEM